MLEYLSKTIFVNKMPKRKYSSYKPVKRYRRRAFKRVVRRRIGRTPMRSMSNPNKIYTFVRCGSLATTTGANAASAAAIQAALNTLTNSSDFTNMFDEYRLCKVITTIWLSYPPSAGAFTTTSFTPTIYWVRDRNNTATPGSVAEITEYAGFRMRRLTNEKNLKIVFVPNTLTTTGGSATMPVYSPWLPTSDATITHYGVKYIIDYLPTGAQVNFLVKYVVQARNCK